MIEFDFSPQKRRGREGRQKVIIFDLTKITHWIFSGLLLIVYSIVFGKMSIPGAIFFAPFIISPIAINVFISCRAKTTATQILSFITTLTYSGWATYVYVDAMIVHVDPQSAIALGFTGIFAAPVLIPAWLACIGMDLWNGRSE